MYSSCSPSLSSTDLSESYLPRDGKQWLQIRKQNEKI
ncbi:hypothetical protein T4D_3415 [Trichinella pseudospiralis]|uniref:Uncharacterized protein n=1 Tax=Trichinella pseudospiralis TaxID=6337 RepID=A0A0V1DPN7_TRIPS|nr:hypothetical protein T4D_3415 [Trichinella pseudospiralis]